MSKLSDYEEKILAAGPCPECKDTGEIPGTLFPPEPPSGCPACYGVGPFAAEVRSLRKVLVAAKALLHQHEQRDALDEAVKAYHGSNALSSRGPDVYIETERPPRKDSRGIDLVRDPCVLVVGTRRYFLGDEGHAEVARGAVLHALRLAARRSNTEGGAT